MMLRHTREKAGFLHSAEADAESFLLRKRRERTRMRLGEAAVCSLPKGIHARSSKQLLKKGEFSSSPSGDPGCKPSKNVGRRGAALVDAF